LRTHQSQDGYHTAVIEVCFGAVERSIEAYALAMTSDSFQDFQVHNYSYERAQQIGVLEQDIAEAMQELCGENQNEIYYGSGRPTSDQTQWLT
jgi:hypothetical protein